MTYAIATPPGNETKRRALTSAEKLYHDVSNLVWESGLDQRNRDEIRAAYAAILAEGALIDGKRYTIDTAAIGKANGTFINRAALRYPRRIPAMDGTYTSLKSQSAVVAHYAALVARFEAISDAMIDEIEAL